MLDQAKNLSARAQHALAGLERLVVAADGGRLKLEWATLLARSGAHVEDLLWWDKGELLGFLGTYAFGSSVELTGMVAPTARRRGIGTALLDAAVPLCRDRGYRQALLVVPRPSTAGAALARRCGAVLEHAEHALVLRTAPTEGRRHPQISLRAAGPADRAVLRRVLVAGFGQAAAQPVGAGDPAHERTLLIEHAGAPIGTVRLTRRGPDGGIYGFVIDPRWQGRGIGREVLRRACRQLRAEGAERIGLEVAVDNDRALGLYTSIGFTQVSTEDYYALPLG